MLALVYDKFTESLGAKNSAGMSQVLDSHNLPNQKGYCTYHCLEEWLEI